MDQRYLCCKHERPHESGPSNGSDDHGDAAPCLKVREAQIVTSVNSALLLPTATTVAAIQHSETDIRCSCNIGPLSISGSVDKADEVAG